MKFRKSKYLIFAFTICLIVACKHKHEAPSEELKQAYAIQKEALTISASLDELGKELPTSLLSRRANWQKNMIEISGMDHDHSNCTHDHRPQTISITDAEMIAVQSAWRDSIKIIKAEALRYINE